MDGLSPFSSANTSGAEMMKSLAPLSVELRQQGS